jgi:hypothetical protein
VTTHQGDWPVPKLVSVLLLFFLCFFLVRTNSRTQERKRIRTETESACVRGCGVTGRDFFLFFFWKDPNRNKEIGQELS